MGGCEDKVSEIEHGRDVIIISSKINNIKRFKLIEIELNFRDNQEVWKIIWHCQITVSSLKRDE